MVVQHNISAMTANRYYGVNNKGLAGSLEKLASGYAINKAGDNAAGLAVSEKMRAQIGGLTQASKNAEDGISLVQTMEGALQETDSILQRMRTLAVQSANGSYQDDVDREAMQLEFDQLNDELNQIADTDFNGTVMLNGGQMADGTKAVDGKIQYGNGTRDPKELSSKDVNKVDYQLFDDKDTTHGQTKADTAWNDLNSTWDRTAAGTNKGPDSVDVTFQYDESTKSWSCTNATNGADSSAISTITSTTNGGFSFETANSGIIADVVLDQTKLQNGDTITLTLNNPYAAKSAPTNAGSEVISSTLVEGADATATTNQSANLTVALTTTAKTDADMTSARNAIFEAFDGATFEMSYTKATPTAATDVKMTLSDGTAYAGSTTGAATTLADGKTKVWLATSADGVVTVSAVKADGTKGDDLMTITPTKSGAADDSSGKITYKIGIENNAYDDSAKPSVEVKEPAGAGVSKSNAFDQSKATMTYTDHLGLQVGARTKDLVDFTFSYNSNGLGDLKANLNCSSRTDGLGTADLSISDQKSANAAIDKIDHALNKVNMVRATFGAAQNRLEHKINNIDTNTENLTAAESRIRDTQMDKEMMKFTSNQILSQASQSMLAQANQLPQGVLQLLG